MVKKNVILICSDQQRGDSLGCMGNTLAVTPNIDALAARGTLYRNHYAANPVCMPSRAALITGCSPRACGVTDNGVPLPVDVPTLPEVLRQNGYRTASFGKLHFQPYKPHEGGFGMEDVRRWAAGEHDGWDGPYYGFERVRLTVGHGEGTGGHYGRWREKNFPELKLGPRHAHGDFMVKRLSSWKSNLPLEAHHSTWITGQALDFLEEKHERPFFMYVSFPDPHHPFTPPAPYSTMFDDMEFPPPHAVEGENDKKPRPYREAMTGRPFPSDGGGGRRAEFTGQAYRQVLAHTFGMITLIDDCVGKIVGKLGQTGLAESTTVIYTSDHGDFLGDHHFLFKGQMPCRSLLNVPLIVFDPERTGGAVDDVVSSIDVMPTVLSQCGVAVPQNVQGLALPEPGRRPGRAYAYEAGCSKDSPDHLHYTIYKNDVRITYYPRLREGELYDLANDPFEHDNLFDDPDWRERRLLLMEELLAAVGAAEPQRPPVLTDW